MSLQQHLYELAAALVDLVKTASTLVFLGTMTTTGTSLMEYLNELPDPPSRVTERGMISEKCGGPRIALWG